MTGRNSEEGRSWTTCAALFSLPLASSDPIERGLTCPRSAAPLTRSLPLPSPGRAGTGTATAADAARICVRGRWTSSPSASDRPRLLNVALSLSLICRHVSSRQTLFSSHQQLNNVSRPNAPTLPSVDEVLSPSHARASCASCGVRAASVSSPLP